jgi:DNA-directed RNA polymerase specialized sigma24 family protein
MLREESFDSFYQATRRAVLHQAFALTGDLAAAQSAVRDAYVSAWHHWRKVSSLEDREAWVRVRAWQQAQRRHRGRIWHRNKGITDEHRRILDGLAKLPSAQRRMLLLVDLAGIPLPVAARELGVTHDVAERQHRAAATALAGHLDTDAARLRTVLLRLDGALTPATLPRGSIIRRAGQKRRQVHTVAATVLAVAVAIGAGTVAYEPARGPVQDDSLRMLRPQPVTETSPADTLPTADNLLDQDQIRRLGSTREWKVTATHANTAGDGINSICQQDRFADPDGLAALVREFEAKGKRERTAVQTVEISESVPQAKQGYRTTLGWYAGCRLGRLQLLDAYRVNSIGAEAGVLMLRVWERPITTYSVAVARIGAVTTTTVGKTVGAKPPPAREITQSLADSVSMLCARSGSTNCAKRPTYRVVPPPPSGEERGLLAVADLPPVGTIEKPWVGTDATSGRPNPSMTTCDRANFVKAGARQTRSRTFLIPEAKLPARFGLSETYGRFPTEKAARRFLDGVRSRVADCEDRDLATTVTSSRTVRNPRPEIDWSAWDLRTEISEREAIRFRVGFVRIGKTVAQLTFVSAPKDDIVGPRFQALVQRAGDRLRELDS